MFSRLVVDVELTNRCNATCTFCPRDNMPQMGHMSRENFYSTVKRIADAGPDHVISFCGTGEPSIHPHFGEFVEYAAKSGLQTQLTTNASRLTRDISEKIVSAGIKRINFSITGIDDVYERIYGLSFAPVRKNILDFVEAADGRCIININLVDYEKYEADLDLKAVRQYWKDLGIEKFSVMRITNRAGAISMAGGTGESYAEAVTANQAILAKHDLNGLCAIAFDTFHIGWDGQYFLCCHDWKHEAPFGHVATHSIAEVYEMKKRYFSEKEMICHRCMHYPANILRHSPAYKVNKVVYEGEDLVRLFRESEQKI